MICYKHNYENQHEIERIFFQFEIRVAKEIEKFVTHAGDFWIIKLLMSHKIIVMWCCEIILRRNYFLGNLISWRDKKNLVMPIKINLRSCLILYKKISIERPPKSAIDYQKSLLNFSTKDFKKSFHHFFFYFVGNIATKEFFLFFISILLPISIIIAFWCCYPCHSELWELDEILLIDNIEFLKCFEGETLGIFKNLQLIFHARLNLFISSRSIHFFIVGSYANTKDSNNWRNTSSRSVNKNIIKFSSSPRARWWENCLEIDHRSVNNSTIDERSCAPTGFARWHFKHEKLKPFPWQRSEGFA